MSKDYRFQVNLGGMIEILSDHLYSSPDVYIRELLQNAADAITARRKLEEAGDSREDSQDMLEAAGREGVHDREDGRDREGAVTLEIEEGRRLVFTDNGLGLTEGEVHQFLAVIGESSKRGLEDGRMRTDYIGRFGIGLLSCFMVADEIIMITRSCRDKAAPVLEWRGKPNGTYTIREIGQGQSYYEGDSSPVELPASPGTKVILYARAGMEDYFTRKTIERLVTYYGLLLPFPVTISRHGETTQINPAYLPWEGRTSSRQELLLFGRMIFGEQFFDCVPIRSQEGNVSGVAYILNYSVLPSAKSSHRIYLKNMLLTEKGDNLIPDWAVFTRCIVNATDLRPTASREGFYADGVLEAAEEEIEDCIISYIEELAERQPERFRRFFQIHQLTLMSLALAAPKLFKLLIDYFEFETTRGTVTGYHLRTCGEPLIYAPTRDKYKQLSQLFFAQDRLLINVAYVHSLDLLEKLGEEYAIAVDAVEDWAVEDLMKDLTPEDQDAGFHFLKKANRILKEYDCRAELKYFSPYNQPTFYLIDENTLLNRQIAASREKADSLFHSMLDTFAAGLPEDTAAVLYFNYRNPIVRKLAAVEDEEGVRLFIEVLYVQALQIGGFALQNNEMGMLNRNILALMERGLSDV